jgi:phosphatidylinositol-3-phosphatase
VSVDPHGRCPDCAAPLAHDQRYCLSCGARVGARSSELLALLARVRYSTAGARADVGEPATGMAGSAAAGPAAAGAGPAEAAAARETAAGPAGAALAGAALAGAEPAQAQSRSRTGGRGGPFAGLTLPSPRVAAVLVLVFLGFGVLLGDAAASDRNEALNASRRDLRLVLGSHAPATAATSPTSTPTGSMETPVSEAEPTPSSAAEVPTGADTAGSGSASAGKGAGKSSGSSHPGESSGEAGGGSQGTGTSNATITKLPKIRHVFVIMLDDQPYGSLFGPETTAHYLASALEPKGALLVRYYAVAHQQLANGVALISGQGPTPQTAENCPTYETITPGKTGAERQVLGNGCVYPADVPTLASQLSVKHLSWRAYLEGMDEGAGTQGACAHPALGAADPTAAQPPPASQTYATWRNPFVYFSALSGSPECAADDVGMSQLKTDLTSVSSTPSFAYIVPDLCNDGNPTPCAPGAPAGVGPADAFLQRVVPQIIASKAYKQSGLLVITADEAPSSGEFADSSACCGQPLFPNLPAPTGGLARPGGGVVGALLLSPFIKSHEISQETYNHFSLLRTVEDLFGLSHLGYAAGSKVNSFEPSLFSGSTGSG